MFGLIPYTSGIANRNNWNSFNMLDRFGDDLFRAFFAGRENPGAFNVDVRDEGENYLLQADLPGTDKENMHIEVENGVLTISADTDQTKEEERGGYVYRERRTGSMKRSFNLEGVDEEGITASYRDGVLEVKLPKKEGEAPRAREIAIG